MNETIQKSLSYYDIPNFVCDNKIFTTENLGLNFQVKMRIIVI